MVQLIIPKSYSRWFDTKRLVVPKKYLNLICLGVLLGLATLSSRAIAATQGEVSADARPIPVLNNIGMIPVQWQDKESTYPYKKFVGYVEQAWLKIPASAFRFNVLNSEVTYELWSTPTGRSELVSNYELHGFVSLTVTSNADVINFTTRLLSPDLRHNYLHEVETVAKSWALSAIDDDVHESLKNLFFRMVNRLPVDTNITSIQGMFATIDKGLDQNLKVGDELAVRRVFVEDAHPATGAWLEFRSKTLGKLKLIEVKPQSAIGQIVSMPYEGAIQIGDGAKIAELPSRIPFKSRDDAPVFAHTHETKSPILYPKPQPPKQAAIVTPSVVEIVQSNQKQTSGGQPSVPPNITSDDDATNEAKDPKEDQSAADTPLQVKPLAKSVDPDIQVRASVRMWKAKGSKQISVASKLPMWLFNSFGVQYTESLGDDLGWDALGRLEFGNTVKGSYAGFGGGGRLHYTLDLTESAKGVFGGSAEFYSIGVSSERYGGEDVIKIIPFGRWVDQVYWSQIDHQLSYHIELDYTPLVFGQVGARDAKRQIKSYSGWHLKVGSTLVAAKPDLWWGGEIMFGSESYKLPQDNINISDFALSLLVGMYL